MKTNKEITAFRHKIIDNYKVSIGCEICGYNKHPSALCFDHLGIEEKAEITKTDAQKDLVLVECIDFIIKTIHHKNF